MRYLYPLVFLLVLSSAALAQSPSLNILPTSSERFFEVGREAQEREILRLQQVRSHPPEDVFPLDIESLEKEREEWQQEREIRTLEEIRPEL